MLTSLDASCTEANDSDGETDLEALFEQRDPKDFIFYFKSVKVHHRNNQGKIFSQVVFTYSHANEHTFTTNLIVPALVLRIEYLMCIGLCILPWFWMGFATKRIIIEAGHLSNEMLQFWESFYNNVLLEFKYVNRLDFDIKVESKHRSQDIFSEAELFPFHSQVFEWTSDIDFVESKLDSRGANRKLTLCPLGGGKDSLVAWHLLKEKNENVEFMYVSDSLYEFEESNRLQDIVHSAQTPVHIIRHEIRSNEFEKYAFSSLTPCGHPWAALVLFDAVLLSHLRGFDEISLGFERSADEGNGVLWGEKEVNHQYDKSSQFLELASAYVREFLSGGIKGPTAVPSDRMSTLGDGMEAESGSEASTGAGSLAGSVHTNRSAATSSSGGADAGTDAVTDVGTDAGTDAGSIEIGPHSLAIQSHGLAINCEYLLRSRGNGKVQCNGLSAAAEAMTDTGAEAEAGVVPAGPVMSRVGVPHIVGETRSRGVVVSSLLQGMWELEIARIFCSAPRLRPFHKLFVSCNEAALSQEEKWLPSREKQHEAYGRKMATWLQRRAARGVRASSGVTSGVTGGMVGPLGGGAHEVVQQLGAAVAPPQRTLVASSLVSATPTTPSMPSSVAERGVVAVPCTGNTHARTRPGVTRAAVLPSVEPPEHCKSTHIAADLGDKIQWCMRCEKCCFVCLLMSAWLEPAELCEIFPILPVDATGSNNTSAGTTTGATTGPSSGPNRARSGGYEGQLLLPLVVVVVETGELKDGKAEISQVDMQQASDPGSELEAGAQSQSQPEQSELTYMSDIMTAAVVRETAALLPLSLLDSASLQSVFLALAGAAEGGAKPFECVGSAREVCAAAELALWRYFLCFLAAVQTAIRNTCCHTQQANPLELAAPEWRDTGGSFESFWSAICGLLERHVPTNVAAICAWAKRDVLALLYEGYCGVVRTQRDAVVVVSATGGDTGGTVASLEWQYWREFNSSNSRMFTGVADEDLLSACAGGSASYRQRLLALSVSTDIDVVIAACDASVTESIFMRWGLG